MPAAPVSVALTRPAVGEFMDSIIANELGLGFEQIEVEESSPLVGQELRNTPIRSEFDIVIISIKRHDGEIIFNPAGTCPVKAGDILIAIGRAESLPELARMARGNG